MCHRHCRSATVPQISSAAVLQFRKEEQTIENKPFTLNEVITEIFMLEQQVKSLEEEVEEACEDESFERADTIQ